MRKFILDGRDLKVLPLLPLGSDQKADAAPGAVGPILKRHSDK